MLYGIYEFVSLLRVDAVCWSHCQVPYTRQQRIAADVHSLPTSFLDSKPYPVLTKLVQYSPYSLSPC
jgi:hypothetical protein